MTIKKDSIGDIYSGCEGSVEYTMREDYAINSKVTITFQIQTSAAHSLDFTLRVTKNNITETMDSSSIPSDKITWSSAGDTAIFGLDDDGWTNSEAVLRFGFSSSSSITQTIVSATISYQTSGESTYLRPVGSDVKLYALTVDNSVNDTTSGTLYVIEQEGLWGGPGTGKLVEKSPPFQYGQGLTYYKKTGPLFKA